MSFNHVLAHKVIETSPLLQKNILHILNLMTIELQPFRLDEELLRKQLISEEELITHISHIFNLPIYDEALHKIDLSITKRFTQDFILKHQLLPLGYDGNHYIVGTTDWFNCLNHHKLKVLLDGPYQIVLMTRAVRERICQMLFSHQETHNLLTNIEQIVASQAQDELEVENKEIDSAPIVQLVDALIKEAIAIGASDIHFEPMPQRVRVRMRIDGILVEKAEMNHKIYASLLTRIKIASNIDITKRRIPQDGRMKYLEDNLEYDCRISTLPVAEGEKVVIRILDHRRLGSDLQSIGINKADQRLIKKLLSAPYGMILVTGPTGCGKTTTLYSFLQELNTANINIVTVEDPIEYRIEGINQLQVNPSIDVTFAKALRSILRQDPDVIMIGEIRDEETAQMATRAAITGHLILATMHTNHASSAISRLQDMKVDAYLTAEALIGVVAQRLVRKLCPHCKTKYQPSPKEIAKMGQVVTELYQAKGCIKCQMTGYEGRVAVLEILIIDDEIRKLIHDTKSNETIKAHAIQKGMRTLKTGCFDLLLKGQTSIQELIRLGII